MRKRVFRQIGLFFLLQALSFAHVSARVSATAPEDLTPQQWGFADEIGMRVPNWNEPEGNMPEEIIVAVLDGGVDYTHPDLEEIVYRFSEEEQAALQCGEYGYDAVAGDTRNPPLDDHASHVAGVIAGAWNDFGVSGAASNVRIVNINCSVGDQTPLEACLRAYAFIEKAIDYGIPIRVINNSWGNVDSSLALNPLIESVGKKGALTVFSAGNFYDNLENTVEAPLNYASRSPYAVIVGSYDSTGYASMFTNYGETVVDIYAPGSFIMSAIASSYAQPYAYGFMSGTSMACPAVVGAACILAANHPEITDAAELKTLLLACARPEELIAEEVKGNGVLDLSVDLSGDYAPVITELSAASERLTIKGRFFGDDTGDLFVTDGSAAHEGDVLSYELVTWSDDTIVADIKDGMPPVCKVVVTKASNQKIDADRFLVAPSDRVYENDYPAIADYAAPDVFDAAPDFQSAGFLGGIDDALYYMPMHFFEEDVLLGFELLYRFDYRAGVWKQLSSLPQRVASTQATIVDDRILLVGTDEARTRSVAYLYDIQTDVWEELPADDVPLRASAVFFDGDVLLVGGAITAGETIEALDTVLRYDMETGACEDCAALTRPVYDALAVAGADTLYVYGTARRFSRIMQEDVDTQYFQRMKDKKTVLLRDPFPAFRLGESNRRPSSSVALHGALVNTDEGLFLIGPLQEDGAADTYLLPDDQSVFLPYEKRLSDAPAFWAAGCYYDGQVFAIARSVLEPGFQIFRSFSLEDPADEAPEKETPAGMGEGTPADALNGETPTDSDAPSQSSSDLLVPLALIVALGFVVIVVSFAVRRKG